MWKGAKSEAQSFGLEPCAVRRLKCTAPLLLAAAAVAATYSRSTFRKAAADPAACAGRAQVNGRTDGRKNGRTDGRHRPTRQPVQGARKYTDGQTDGRTDNEADGADGADGLKDG
jgi:hypothetical protein